ncbi:MAG: fructosamine kinase family protein, partial [Alphaproteobacteria bacterium]
MIAAETKERLARLAGHPVESVERLPGGCIGDVFKVSYAGAAPVVAKIGGAGSGLAVEGWMLRYLAERTNLPVPRVIEMSDELLVMDYVEADGSLDAEAEGHAAALLAELHDVAGPRFGFERDTLIGGLRQPNDQSASWRDFFAVRRLGYMAEQANDAGRLPDATRRRVEAVAARLDRWIDEPPQPALIHGDVWGGNVLCGATGAGNRIAAFLDPAIYHADPEIELAFSTLFGTFGEAFFAVYGERRPIRPGFFELRRDLYNLYPLLVHVRLFG